MLVVDADRKVAVKRIRGKGGAAGTIVVDEGLAEGELVIVEGIQKVRPGQVVQATEAPAAPGG